MWWRGCCLHRPRKWQRTAQVRSRFQQLQDELIIDSWLCCKTMYEPAAPSDTSTNFQDVGWLVLSRGGDCLIYSQSSSADASELTEPLHISCRVSLPVSTPTACAFAGDEQKLYITTINDKSKGAGGLWSYHLPGLAGWSGAHIAKPLY